MTSWLLWFHDDHTYFRIRGSHLVPHLGQCLHLQWEKAMGRAAAETTSGDGLGRGRFWPRIWPFCAFTVTKRPGRAAAEPGLFCTVNNDLVFPSILLKIACIKGWYVFKPWIFSPFCFRGHKHDTWISINYVMIEFLQVKQQSAKYLDTDFSLKFNWTMGHHNSLSQLDCYYFHLPCFLSRF